MDLFSYTYTIKQKWTDRIVLLYLLSYADNNNFEFLHETCLIKGTLFRLRLISALDKMIEWKLTPWASSENQEKMRIFRR